MTDPHEEHHFGDGEPFTIGLEEELFLVDPADGHLRNTGADVIEQLGELPRGDISNELHRSQIELITGVCATVSDAVAELGELRRAVLATGAGFVAFVTHQTAVEGDSEFTVKRRYERIHELLGDAGATPVCGMHVHVGMPDPETAIRVFNGLRRHLPLLEALAANSPYRHGRDTGLASARALTLRSWPRAGVPRAMEDLDDFLHSTARLSHVAGVPDYTFHWWKLRPHPRIGTVEIRALDTQLSPRHTAALAAAVQSLALFESRARPVEGPPAEILDEASFRASRGGVEATLPDEDDRLRPVPELLERMVEAIRPAAVELGCVAQLDDLAELLADGGGAGIQRRSRRGDAAGIDGVLDALVARAEPTGDEAYGSTPPIAASG
jgi:carboxylate-amine ligase